MILTIGRKILNPIQITTLLILLAKTTQITNSLTNRHQIHTIPVNRIGCLRPIGILIRIHNTRTNKLRSKTRLRNINTIGDMILIRNHRRICNSNIGLLYTLNNIDKVIGIICCLHKPKKCQKRLNLLVKVKRYDSFIRIRISI